MKRVNELKEGLKNFELGNPAVKGDPSVTLTLAAKKLMADLDNKGESFSPDNFVDVMREVFPQFDEVDEKTQHHKQQDAEECYTQFLSSFQFALKHAKQNGGPKEDVEMAEEGQKRNDLVQDLFGIELENTVKNTMTEEEPEEVSSENVLKLPCHIDNSNNPVSNM